MRIICYFKYLKVHLIQLGMFAQIQALAKDTMITHI